MRVQVEEAIVRALVDELGLDRTIDILERAMGEEEAKKVTYRSAEFIGMASFAKNYAAKKNVGRN